MMKAGSGRRGTALLYRILLCCVARLLIPTTLALRTRKRSGERKAFASRRPLAFCLAGCCQRPAPFVTLVTTPVPRDREALGEREAAGGAGEMTAGRWRAGQLQRLGRIKSRWRVPGGWVAHLSTPPPTPPAHWLPWVRRVALPAGWRGQMTSRPRGL